MRDLMDVLKALADENRLRMARALSDGELCVCRLIALLDLAPSTVSKHLSILRAARLVESRKEGRWLYYRLPRTFRPPAAGTLLTQLFAAMDNTPQGQADRRKLAHIAQQDPEVLCRRILCKR